MISRLTVLLLLICGASAPGLRAQGGDEPESAVLVVTIENLASSDLEGEGPEGVPLLPNLRRIATSAYRGEVVATSDDLALNLIGLAYGLDARRLLATNGVGEAESFLALAGRAGRSVFSAHPRLGDASPLAARLTFPERLGVQRWSFARSEGTLRSFFDTVAGLGGWPFGLLHLDYGSETSPYHPGLAARAWGGGSRAGLHHADRLLGDLLRRLGADETLGGVTVVVAGLIEPRAGGEVRRGLLLARPATGASGDSRRLDRPLSTLDVGALALRLAGLEPPRRSPATEIVVDAAGLRAARRVAVSALVDRDDGEIGRILADDGATRLLVSLRDRSTKSLGAAPEPEMIEALDLAMTAGLAASEGGDARVARARWLFERGAPEAEAEVEGLLGRKGRDLVSVLGLALDSGFGSEAALRTLLGAEEVAVRALAGAALLARGGAGQELEAAVAAGLESIENPAVLRRLAGAVGGAGLGDLAEPLRRAAARVLDPDLQASVALALVRLGDAAARADLERCFLDPRLRFDRSAAVRELESREPERAEALVAIALEAGTLDPVVVRAALDLLRRRSATHRSRLVAGLFGHPDLAVRIAARDLVADWGPAAGYESLVRLLRHDGRYLGRVAAAVVEIPGLIGTSLVPGWAPPSGSAGGDLSSGRLDFDLEVRDERFRRAFAVFAVADSGKILRSRSLVRMSLRDAWVQGISFEALGPDRVVWVGQFDRRLPRTGLLECSLRLDGELRGQGLRLVAAGLLPDVTDPATVLGGLDSALSRRARGTTLDEERLELPPGPLRVALEWRFLGEVGPEERRRWRIQVLREGSETPLRDVSCDPGAAGGTREFDLVGAPGRGFVLRLERRGGAGAAARVVASLRRID